MSLYDDPTERFPAHRPPRARRIASWALMAPVIVGVGWVTAWSFDDGISSDYRERAQPPSSVVRPDDDPVPPLARAVADEKPRTEENTVKTTKPPRPARQLGDPIVLTDEPAPPSKLDRPTVDKVQDVDTVPVDELPLDDGTEQEVEDNTETKSPPTTAVNPPTCGGIDAETRCNWAPPQTPIPRAPGPEGV